jgi:hypothetical protein
MEEHDGGVGESEREIGESETASGVVDARIGDSCTGIGE